MHILGKFWLVWCIFQIDYIKCVWEIIVCVWDKNFSWLTKVLTKLIKITVFWDAIACNLVHYIPTFWRNRLPPCQEFWYRSTRIHGITSHKTLVFRGCVAACLSLFVTKRCNKLLSASSVFLSTYINSAPVWLIYKPVGHFNYHHKIFKPEVVVLICVCVCVCVYNFFSFLLDFGTNPEFNMEAVQNLQRVNMPKCSFFSFFVRFWH